jgi:hypothetical protein
MGKTGRNGHTGSAGYRRTRNSSIGGSLTVGSDLLVLVREGVRCRYNPTCLSQAEVRTSELHVTAIVYIPSIHTHNSKLYLLLIANQPINSARMQTPRNRNIRRRRVHRRIAQEIHRRSRQIALLAEALVRRRQPHLLALALAGLCFADVARLVRVDEARRDGVDTDAVRSELDAEDFGELHHAAFGGVVGGHAVAWQGDVRGLRGDEEDAAGGFAVDEVFGDHLGCEECAADLCNGSVERFRYELSFGGRSPLTLIS